MASTVPLATPAAPQEAPESDAFSMLLLASTGGSATQSNSRESTASLSNEEQPQMSLTSGLLEIPGACGRASTYLNPARGPKSLAILQQTGWTLGSSISRIVAGSLIKVLKVKWRVGNSDTGPIIVGFASQNGQLLAIQHDDTLVEPVSIVKLTTRLPQRICEYPEPCDGSWARDVRQHYTALRAFATPQPPIPVCAELALAM